MALDKIVEYRGCKGLVFADITTDDNETGTGHGYTTGTVNDLAGVAEISKTVSVSKVSKYYDNVAAIVITGEGEDVVTFTTSIPSLPVQAAINGRVYDATLKMYIECPIVNKYYAVGYVIEDTDGTEYYIWRHKGYFVAPDETSATKDDGTDGNNQSLEFHGIYTIHEFANGGGSGVKKNIKSFKMANDGTLDLSAFFATVTSPDTVFTAPNP
jgi:hypothetical protein